MFERICKAILDVTGKSMITMETDFVRDLGMNSFDVIAVIGVFEDEYNIRIPTRDIWKLRTVRDLADYLEKLS